ncbi:Family S53 protease [Mycena kentingensis (nom. inval.)]|nr:Family S53 protease [Mycena kentingensis (nom. inval.)]
MVANAKSFFILAAAFFASTNASPFLERRGYHQSFRRAAPSGFASLGTAPADQELKFRIALTSSNATGLQQQLLAVSDPTDPSYGQHLTKAEINNYLKPSPEALTAVSNWLGKNNVSFTSGEAGDWLFVNVPVAKANSLLSANFETFQHAETGKTYQRTLNLALPDTVAPFIEHIVGTTEFNKPLSARPVPVMSVPLNKRHGGRRNRGGRGGNGAGTGGATGGGATGGATGGNGNAATQQPADPVTPAILQQLYGIPTTPATEQSNRIAVPGFLDQFAQEADTQLFLQNFRKDIDPATTFETAVLDGGQNLQGAQFAGVEANLDIQYTIGVATGVPIQFISVGNQNQDGALGGFLDIITALLAEDDVPQTMTTSYGFDETDLPAALASKLCDAYAALGARGTSIMFASGDGGVAGGQAQACTTFIPVFPASCPFLTSVGSTFGLAPEVGSDFSSGGFSETFARPDYQEAAVQAYLDKIGDLNAGLFNAAGRGFPDVAAQGENLQVVNGGQLGGVDGTSASSPIFASIIGLINDELVAGGKAPLGFLNPFLYQNAAALTDVVDGNNPGCNTDGFPAAEGWDAVTGLGTPSFERLRTAAGL